MPQSLAKLYIHLIFSTKNRQHLLSIDLQESLHAFLGIKLKETGCLPIKINSAGDHIHLLFELSRTAAVSDVIQHIKSTSSQWIKKREDSLTDFSWQNGYGAFSVSMSNIEAVKLYIQNQQEHHKTLSFQDEYRQFLIRHDISFDERYVWD